MWWSTLVLPAQGSLRMKQEDWECEPSVSYMRPCLRKRKYMEYITSLGYVYQQDPTVLCHRPIVSGTISSLPCSQGAVLWGCVQRRRWGEGSKHIEILGKTSGAWDLSHSPGEGEEVTFQPIPLTRTWCIFYRPHDSPLSETLKPWSPTALENLPRCKMTFLLDH